MLLSNALALLSILSLACGADDTTVTAQDSDNSVTIQSTDCDDLTGSACSCKVLQTLFPKKVLLPGTSAYTAEQTHFYDEKAQLRPGCIFVPTSASDVSKAILVLTACKTQFSVRGGGHMPIKGAASIDGGVLIALSGMTDITVSSDKTSVFAGPGNTWIKVYSAIEKYGLVVAGGRIPSVGIAGFTLGGGLSHLMNKYGFAADTVKSYEIVLANGKIVTASSKSNPDLFWALKGGGNNFGIVTKFEYMAYQAPIFVGTTLVYTEAELPAYFNAVADIAKSLESTQIIAGGIYVTNYKPATGAVQPTFLGANEGNVVPPPVFRNFSAIPSVFSSYNVTTLAQFTSTLDAPYGVTRSTFGTHGAVADGPTLFSLWQQFKAAVTTMVAIPGLSCDFVMQPFNPHAFAVSKTNGIGNALNFNADKPRSLWMFVCAWDNASDDAKMLTWHDTVLAQMFANITAAGMSTPDIYMNDAAASQKPFLSYGGDSLARLKKVRGVYDPNLVFKNLMPGGFKLD